MSKRDPNSDQPRRIWLRTIERIDKHLLKRPREVTKKNYKSKSIKGDFNKFIEHLLDTYEELQKAPAYYLYGGVIYEDASEARGKAIIDSVKNKKPAIPPTIMIAIGEDEL